MLRLFNRSCAFAWFLMKSFHRDGFYVTSGVVTGAGQLRLLKSAEPNFDTTFLNFEYQAAHY